MRRHQSSVRRRVTLPPTLKLFTVVVISRSRRTALLPPLSYNSSERTDTASRGVERCVMCLITTSWTVSVIVLAPRYLSPPANYTSRPDSCGTLNSVSGVQWRGWEGSVGAVAPGPRRFRRLMLFSVV